MLSTLIAVGDAAGALELVKRTLQTWRHPWFLGRLGVASAMVGDRETAQAVFNELEARSHTDYVQKIWLAVIAAALGRVDEAIDLMHQGIKDRDPISVWVVVLPECAPLRAHPRYAELLHDIGLYAYWKKHPPAPPGS
jgi:hypothetical protein